MVVIVVVVSSGSGSGQDPSTDPILDNPNFRGPLFKKCDQGFLLRGGTPCFFIGGQDYLV